MSVVKVPNWLEKIIYTPTCSRDLCTHFRQSANALSLASHGYPKTQITPDELFGAILPHVLKPVPIYFGSLESCHNAVLPRSPRNVSPTTKPHLTFLLPESMTAEYFIFERTHPLTEQLANIRMFTGPNWSCLKRTPRKPIAL